MKLLIKQYELYDYDPKLDGELIGILMVRSKDYECNIEARVCLTECVGCHIKYICNYKKGNKRYISNTYDSFAKTKEEIKCNMMSCVEECYNRHKRGKKVKFTT